MTAVLHVVVEAAKVLAVVLLAPIAILVIGAPVVVVVRLILELVT